MACKSHELCYNKKIRRGYISGDDISNIGANTSYYLHIQKWFFMSSPMDKWPNYSSLIDIYEDGHLFSHSGGNNGGVH